MVLMCVIANSLLRVCTENTAWGGHVERLIQLRTHKYRQCFALSVILYFLVVWLGVIFSSTQTAAIFGISASKSTQV